MGENWRDVRGANEIRAEEESIRRRRQELVDGLRRCPECGGYAKAVIFGPKGRGVWVGCDRMPECARHIVWHSEGWSLEECCEEWNRLNGGIWLFLKKARLFFTDRFGRCARWDRAERKRREKAKREAEAERKRVFGTEKAHRSAMIRAISYLLRNKKTVQAKERQGKPR